MSAINGHHDEEGLKTIHSVQHMFLSVFQHEILSINGVIGLETIQLIFRGKLRSQSLTCKQLPKIAIWSGAITCWCDSGANVHLSLQYVG